MLTVITKQDLWWPERHTVDRWYSDGDYNGRIADVIQRRGEDNFHHSYISASLVANNFYSGDHELLAQTAEGYDQILRNVNLQNLLTAVVELVKA